MLQSLIVYGGLAFLMWWFGTIAAKRELTNIRLHKETSFWTWEMILPMLLFAFISGVRWKVGTDHQSYLNGYMALIHGTETRELEGAFMYFSQLFAYLNLHFTFFFGFWAFLQISFMYLTFKNERYLLPYIGIIIVFGGHYVGWMNVTRQIIAACIFVYSIQFIYDRKALKYFLLIFIATLFHKSAVLLFVFYFIPQRDYFKNRFISLGLLLLAVIIGSNPYWIDLLNNLEGLLHYIGYEGYAEHLERWIIERQKEMNLGPRRLSRVLLSALIIWYHPQLKNKFQNTHYQTYFNLHLIGAILHNLLANTGHIFLRPTAYFTIFMIPTAAYFLHFLKYKKFKELPVMYIITFLLIISYMLVAIVSDNRLGELDWTNYKFFWDYV